MANDFSKLSAENGEHRLAQLSSEEIAECNSYLDEMNARLDALENIGKMPVAPVTEGK